MQPTAEILLVEAQPAVDTSWNTRLDPLQIYNILHELEGTA